MKTIKTLISFAVVGSVLAVGCEIHDYSDSEGFGPHEGFDPDGFPRDPNAADVPVCVEFCGTLVGCGTVSPHDLLDCLDGCEYGVRDEPERVTNGCYCVIDDACRDIDEYDCDGAPMPDPGTPGGGTGQGGGAGPGGGTGQGGAAGAGTGAGAGGGAGAAGTAGSAQGGSSAGGAAGGGGPECVRNHDCGTIQDCVSGTCRTRCEYSCQCDEGESCEDGYCFGQMPPPPTCETHCDCPSGQRCTEGECL